jgi:mRNA-degrading endonuclease RelE of RelBE toxin-antitoxin system
MNAEIFITKRFEKEAKKYLKKFKSLKSELEELINELTENPSKGTSLGNSAYKIRLASKSKGKGKSGGFRIITYLVESIENKDKQIITLVTLLSIYDKSETEKILTNEINTMINIANKEINEK